MLNELSAIIGLFRQGKRQCEIVRLFKVPQQTVSKAIHRFNELGHEGDCAGRERKRTANIYAKLKITKKRLQRNSRMSVRKIARETGISKSSVHRIVKRNSTSRRTSTKNISSSRMRIRLERCRQLKHRATGQRWERILFTDKKLFTLEQTHNHQNDRRCKMSELNLKAYKLQKVQLLADEKKRVRLERCRQLKHRATGQRWERILFTDEKLLTLEQEHNHQNDSPLRLPARRPSSNIAIIRLWYGPGFTPVARPPRFRGSGGQKQPRSLSSRHSRHSRDRSTLVGSTELRRYGLDVPAGLRAGSQGEIDSGLVQGPFSRLHHVGGMASLLT
ncbi:hypothetical protein LAZ67_5000032 [Cordylochernes scorpioides]|uniref:Uncharacterized protein n=1 Tax=Cordylochernes scorpioides TaxID=51811 RepID=A0ABY6KHJ9_9ARAC|nr:hypothetical protein LAZ67_5000032 [Cordylochernes scorpioides]